MSSPKPVREILPGAIKMMRAFWPQIVKEKKLLVLSVTAVIFGVGFQLLEPWPLKLIYDCIFHVTSHSGNLPLLKTLRPSVLLPVSALSMVAITGFAAIADYFSAVCLSLAASRILAEIRGRLFQHLANLSISFHNRNKTGDLITRVTYDIDRLREVIVTSVLPLINNTLTLSAMLVVMFWMNWRLALIVLVAFPLFFAAVLRLTRKIKEVARVQRSREGAMAATTAEAIGSIRIVQALSLQKLFLGVFSVANTKSLQAGAKAQKLSAGLERTVEVLAASTTALVLWSGARQVLNGFLTPGDLIVFVSYLRTGFKPLRQLAKYLGQIAKALASGERILDLLDVSSEIQDSPTAISAPPFAGRIRFENVYFEYEPGSPVLRNLSFEIGSGDHVAVVGPSGSGKSTLASLLLRFHDPTAGRILIDGRDIRDYTLESLRSQMSIVMQDSVLFAVTVRDNIGFGAVGAGTEDIIEAARLANAHGFITEMSQQYDTILGERGATVSGGQRQRIAIARAAVRKAPIIILDEPTTGLDLNNEREVTAALDRLSENRTTLLITHNLESVRDCDLVLYIGDGTIAELGCHEELLARDSEYAAMYRSQSQWVPRKDKESVYALSF